MKFFTSLLIIVLMSGCTYYQTAPSSSMSKFDQSWNAANGANVTITLITQASGGVRVEFDTTGTSTVVEQT